MSKLYKISVEVISFVLAESEEEARKIAERNRALESDFSSIDYREYDICDSRGVLDGGYEGDSSIFHSGRENITFDQAVALTKLTK